MHLDVQHVRVRLVQLARDAHLAEKVPHLRLLALALVLVLGVLS